MEQIISIISDIPGITDGQIEHLLLLIEQENIVDIRICEASGHYQEDDVYQFIDETGYRPFSVLVHPDKSVHLWRPL